MYIHQALTLFHPGGGRISPPPTTYFVVNCLNHIERPCNFLAFPKYGFQTDLLGVPLSVPLEKVEIYFSKIAMKIFGGDTIFIIAELFYSNKTRMFAKK